MKERIQPLNHIKGTYRVPGDKSISHRAVMFGALAEGATEIEGFLPGADCLSTIACFRGLGIRIEQTADAVRVYGKGLYGLTKPDETLDAGNSGTTVRLLAGILSGQPFQSRITGDASIQKRPMDRVIDPLRAMGADLTGKDGTGFAPLTINGRRLRGITYEMPVASAQVKSSVLLAGLYAETPTTVIEKEKTRDHTEIMLRHFGADITVDRLIVSGKPVRQLYAQKITVPGDISSAAFLIVAALILPDSSVLIQNVGINETRTGILTALTRMGATIGVENRRLVGGEPVADLSVRSSSLKGIQVEGGLIPAMIDEIPVFAVASLFAEGETVIRDAAELKVKESNRIRVMVDELQKMGADIRETADGMVIRGGAALKGAAVESHNDHRVAMSLAVAALKATGETEINGAECAVVSFPDFYRCLRAR